MIRNLLLELLHRGRSVSRDFARDRNGNVMMIFTLSMVPLFLFVGAALDYTRALDARTKMRSVADLASIAATRELLKDDGTEEKAKAIAEQIFNSQINGNPQAYGILKNVKPNVVATKTTIDGKITGRVEIGATAELDLVLASTLGNLKMFDIGVRSVSENEAESLGALSMFFVLDRSGSMDWSNKMEDLKKASGDMLAQLAAADPDSKYVRTGAAGYNTGLGVHESLNWGVTHTNAFTQALVAKGGTNTSVGMNMALVELKHKREERLHLAKNEQVPKKFILLLTDGANNKSSWDKDTLRRCDEAKAIGIEIYTVAFKAPSAGEKLLKKCASDVGYYFDAGRTDELVAAFKTIGNQVSRAIPRVTH